MNNNTVPNNPDRDYLKHNQIEVLHDVLACCFPDAFLKLQELKGSWTMDVRLGDYFLVVDWQEGVFLLTSDETHGYGEPADEAYRDFRSVMERCMDLIDGKLPTVPPEDMIKELKETSERVEWGNVAKQALQLRMLDGIAM